MVISSFLHKINTVHEAPADTYLIYNIQGGIYYINVRDFPNFTTEWIGLSRFPCLTMDLSSTCTHSVILDLDCHSHTTLAFIFQIVETVLKMMFLPTLSHFTYILAKRKKSFGIHVHLPEFRIGHDDYILLCETLQQKFLQALIPDPAYELDIPMNAMLPGANKPNCTVYSPHTLVYVDEQHMCKLDMERFSEEYPAVKKTFPRRKYNENSLFRSLLKLTSQRMLVTELKHLMMPVIDARTDAPIYTLVYHTSIGKYPNNAPDSRDVASFTCKKTHEPGYICKSKKLTFHQTASTMKVFYHLKLNACNLVDFMTCNHAIKRWYDRFGRRITGNNADAPIPDLFRDLHESLQFEHRSLSQDPNPIKTIMQYNDGYYFLPVFYTLCQHYQLDPKPMAEHLHALLDTAFVPLLAKMAALNPQNVQFAELTLNTLHFCANNLYEQQPRTNRDKLKSIVENNYRAIWSVTTQDQMADLLRSMQERHLPIYLLKLRNALKKPTRFVWNALSESWQEITNDKEIVDHMQNLWNCVKQFCVDFRASGVLGGPDDDLVKGFTVGAVVSTIMSDTAMERKDIQMDMHKWLLRLQDGLLDVLTGHIGGVVPEWFLSDRKVSLGIPRARMSVLCNRAEELERVYDRLVSKPFFLQYLQALFLDRAPTLFDALQHVLLDSMDASSMGVVKASSSDDDAKKKIDPLAESMLHFYVNLCKCTSFEYDLFVYMLDVLASVLIGTNYMRKFFVWKGLTRNGKSKLFELMGKVLGGYYHSIQSENLTPGHSANNATPELASTLFSCRMVTSEELDKRLDENRVKQITGNSFVTFRNMYEQNSGGIPTAKVFATTNNYPECKASEAFKDRVRAIPFDAEFAEMDPATRTSEQVRSNKYRKDAFVVEQSYKGCFFMLYYHLKRRMSPEDGLLHYRPDPACVVEFTEDYLIHADLYVQFKLHMDVQLRAGTQTTLNEVRSAVRQYLKSSRNTSFHETELMMAFEKEFGHLRQTDIKVGHETFSYMGGSLSMGLDGEPGPSPSKKMKLDTEASLVFYDGVVIKNLKRQNMED